MAKHDFSSRAVAYLMFGTKLAYGPNMLFLQLACLALASGYSMASDDVLPQTVPVEGSTPESQRVADYVTGVAQFELYKEQRRQSVSHERHLPRAYLHGEKTRYSAVVLHGLFESPNYIKGISQTFHEAGMNVISVLYSGHWVKGDPKAVEKVPYQAWQNDRDEGLRMAKLLGDQVVLVGYSLGGALAFETALSQDPFIAGLIAICPTLQMSGGALIAAGLGVITGLNGNTFAGGVPDGYDTPYYSSKAGTRVSSLSDSIFKKYGKSNAYESDGPRPDDRWRRQEVYQQIRVPTFVVQSDRDNAVETSETVFFYESIPNSTPKQMVFYDAKTWVTHQSVAKFPGDTFTYSSGGYNPRHGELKRQLLQFVGQYFRN